MMTAFSVTDKQNALCSSNEQRVFLLFKNIHMCFSEHSSERFSRQEDEA